MTAALSGMRLGRRKHGRNRREAFPPVDFDWKPASRRLSDSLILDPEHVRYGRAGQVGVEDSDAEALQAEGEAELDCQGGFADAAFAGENLCGGTRCVREELGGGWGYGSKFEDMGWVGGWINGSLRG